jgi:hypothetical protein
MTRRWISATSRCRSTGASTVTMSRCGGGIR